MEIYSLKNTEIFIIDLSGTSSLSRGLLNIGIIEKKIKDLSINRRNLKLIIDFRNTTWENKETHDALSKTARIVFNPQNFSIPIFVAILNNEITGSSFENEQWFTGKEEAIEWLVKR